MGDVDKSYDEKAALKLDDEIKTEGSTKGSQTEEWYDEGITEGSTGVSEKMEVHEDNAEPTIEDEKGNVGSTYAGVFTETTGADEKLLKAPGDVNGEPMNEENEAATIEGSANESQTEQSYYEGSANESYDENTKQIIKDGINEGSISTKGSENVDEPYDEKAELKMDDEIESEGSTKGSKTEYDEGIPEGSTSDSEAVESYDENGEPLLEDKKGSTYAGDVTETTGTDGKLLMAPGDVNGEPMNEETEAATIEDQSDVTEGSANESQTEELYYEGSTSESYDENTEPITEDGINEGSISTKGSEDVDKSYDEKAELKIDDEIESEGLTKK